MNNWRGRLLLRGESGVAGMGLAMARLLVMSFAANAWLTDQGHQESLDQLQRTQLRAIGHSLSEKAQQLIARDELPLLRRLVANTATELKLGGCTVSIGNGRILADAQPSRVNVTSLPPRWSVPADEAAAAQFRFEVPNRGAGSVTLTPGPVPTDGSARFAVSASICAFALAVLVLVYHRSRSRLAELDVVRSSLAATQAGETAVPALLVDARLGPTATAWNTLIEEIDALRQKARTNTAAAATGRQNAGANIESACNAMSQGIVMIDEAFRVRFANGAACSFLKFDRTQVVGMPAGELLVNEEYRQAFADVTSGKARRPVTAEIEQPSDAGVAILRVCIRPVRRGDADSAMILIEDVTQQRAAERARNQFINQVTHELRTPLTNIRLYAETAIEDGESNAEVRANCLNVINTESRRLERIVSEMLSVAEIEAGSTMIKQDEVYADALIKDLERDYAAQAKDKNITLQFVVSPKLPKLTCDKDKFGIALHNLIGNALKYTPEGGRVTVKVDVRDGKLCVDVNDTGIGIEKAEQDKIFDRFFRSADQRVGKIVGTGLGLTLAREVMRLHGGDVTVESELNRGSTFTATLPVAMAA
jgi:PAS domain S-box-containing protein